MSPDQTRPAQATAKSPILGAIGISLAVALGAVLGTLDLATIEDAVTGRWFTRAYTETQQGHTVAIAALENSIAIMTREIDFVASRVDASIRRNEDKTFARFVHLDAEITALKDKIAGIQSARFAPPLDAPGKADVTGLRSSLHDLASAHNSAVAAITRRLDRIEVSIGISTDMTSSVTDPVRQAARRNAAAKSARKTNAPIEQGSADPGIARPERGHIFSVKPISQQGAPLRLSKAPG
jgi:hypothetical protein